MSVKFRLLRVADVPDNRLGGMSRTMHETGDHLGSMGFEVDYLFGDAFGSRFSHAWRRFTGPWETAKLVRKAAIKYGAYDLVEIHEPLALGSGVLRHWALSGARLVAFSYGLESRSLIEARKYQRQHGGKTRFKSRITAWLQAQQSALGLRLCDYIVCSNSEDVNDLLARGWKREQVTLHHSGVDDGFLKAGREVIAASRRDILFFGSWIERKGILDLVPAIVPLLRAHPDLRFTIAGCQVEEAVVLKSFPDDVRRNIRVISEVTTQEQLFQIYSGHGILILPSFFEGQPLVMIEAAAFGMAIVTTAVCGMLDFIRDGDNGVLVPVGDASALEWAVGQLVDDSHQIRRLGGAARRDAEAHTWMASAENLAASYREIIARSATTERARI